MMINICIYLGSSIKAFGSFLNYLFLALPSNLVNARDNYNSRCEQVNNILIIHANPLWPKLGGGKSAVSGRYRPPRTAGETTSG